MVRLQRQHSVLVESLSYSSSDKPSLQVLDQLLIPEQKKYIEIHGADEAWSVIRNMQIRGAPLIAVVACLSLAVDLCSNPTTLAKLDQLEQQQQADDKNAILELIQGKLDYLLTSRPTAVNLYNALSELRATLDQALLVATKSSSVSPRHCLVHAVKEYAEFALKRDLEDCRNMGKHGADELLLKTNNNNKKGLTVMTICNTGSLACSGYGTALGVVRALQEREMLETVVALETRPYNQGSRLTAYELVHEEMPGATLICDSMAAAYMRANKVDAVVVGADRVCANGDTANKIGTYSLALVAAAHGVPVYVVAPCTTLDLEHATGDQIVIEERPAEELITTARAPRDINVWNPAFDVTPARYITGVITDKGVIRPAVDGTINVKAFLESVDNGAATTAADVATTNKLTVPFDYHEQSVQSLPSFLVKNVPTVGKILGTTNADDLECVEVGDGNLNLVFIVTNKETKEQVIVKQALPYVRCVGEAWPLTLERSYFEYKALMAEKEACPEFVPSIYFFSRKDGLIVMQYLAPPNIILRKGLIQGIRYPTMASDMGVFCAKTIFKTSGFKLTATQIREQVEFWTQNVEMCALTEQVVFTEPYKTADNNRWTTPHLDDDKRAIETDVELRLGAAKYKHKFVTETQALIHADLHSGSVMCSPEPGKTFVIDPEFGFYGPMGFDLGAFIANLFLAFVAQDGHSNGEDYANWLLEQIEAFWYTFVKEFTKLWNDPMEHTGYLYGRQTLQTSEELQHGQRVFFDYMLTESLGFAGMKMLRRIVGIAHVEDLDSIQDVEVKAKCERRGLEIAKKFVKSAAWISSIEEAIRIARETTV